MLHLLFVDMRITIFLAESCSIYSVAERASLVAISTLPTLVVPFAIMFGQNFLRRFVWGGATTHFGSLCRRKGVHELITADPRACGEVC